MTCDVLTETVESYIVLLFQQRSDPALAFHNVAHTRTVVSRVQEISGYYQLADRDLFVVTAAAWFHDAGYLFGGQHGHERLGADMVRAFLETHNLPGDVIDDTSNCILATTLPQRPSGILEQIVCDADLFHFGTPELFTRDKLMRKEVELRMGCGIDEAKWVKGTIQLLESHSYHTSYCQGLLNRQKEANLNALKARLRECTR